MHFVSGWRHPKTDHQTDVQFFWTFGFTPRNSDGGQKLSSLSIHHFLHLHIECSRIFNCTVFVWSHSTRIGEVCSTHHYVGCLEEVFCSHSVHYSDTAHQPFNVSTFIISQWSTFVMCSNVIHDSTLVVMVQQQCARYHYPCSLTVPRYSTYSTYISSLLFDVESIPL